jgi:tRNA nucleotidyltransferase/poly(A) polymerase
VDAPRFPESVKAVIEHLLAEGHHIWAVGGALRDFVLGRTARDFDFIVASTLAAVKESLPAARMIAARDPTLKLPRTASRPQIEITSIADRGHSLSADLEKRDFTLNALAFDLLEERWSDPTGGLADLAASVLRAANAAQVFRSDPVRILRGLRLAAELDLDVESSTHRAMELDSWRLQLAAGERLREELFRILRMPRAAEVLEQLRQCGALAAVLPELLRGVGVVRPDASTDVFRESLALCDAVRPEPLQRLAALILGSGTSAAKRYLRRSGEFQLQRLELHSAALVPAIARRLRMSRRQAAGLERRLCNQRLVVSDERAVRRMLERAGRDSVDDLLELHRAQLALQNPGGNPPADWMALEARIRSIAAHTKCEPLAIGAREVMQVLGISEGPEVGTWLRRLHWRVVERPEENERSALQRWLRRARSSRVE